MLTRGLIGVESDYVIDNDAERGRLDAVAVTLSEDDLGRRLRNGLTVAAALVHLAFWDDYCCALLEQWEQTGFAATRSNFDVLNAAIGHLAHAVPADSAPGLARVAAQRVDRRVSAIPKDLAVTIETNGYESILHRAAHRRLHLDRIEEAVAGAQG